MLRYSWVLAALTVAACGGGGSDENDGPDISGDWGLDTSDGCILALGSTKETYRLSLICELNTGDIGIEVEEGDLAQDGDTITFIPTRSSCADEDGEPTSFEVSVDDDKLRLMSGSAALLFAAGGDEGDIVAGRVSLYGCFADDGAFTTGRLRDI